MRRWIASGLLAVVMSTVFPVAAQAGSGGRKNTAIGLTAAAAAVWLNGGTKKAGRRNTAIGLTAASAVAWHKYKKAKKSERRQARVAAYYRSRPARVSGYRRATSRRRPASSYRTGYRAGYRAGYLRGTRA